MLNIIESIKSLFTGQGKVHVFTEKNSEVLKQVAELENKDDDKDKTKLVITLGNALFKELPIHTKFSSISVQLPIADPDLIFHCMKLANLHSLSIKVDYNNKTMHLTKAA